MKQIQQTLDTKTRSKLRLTEIVRLVEIHRIIVPAISRRTLARMCEEGIFETVGNEPTKLGWLVYEDSFWEWARSLEK